MGFNPKMIQIGAGSVLVKFRTGTISTNITVTPKTGSTPTTTSFIVVTADKNKLKVGDILALASLTSPLYTVAEASTQPRITAIAASGSDWVVTVSPAFGSAPAAGSASVQKLYNEMGATDGDIEFGGKIQVNKQMVDQSLIAVAAVYDLLEIMLKCPFAEATAYNIAQSLGLSTQVLADTTIDLSAPSTNVAVEMRVLTVSPGPNGLTRWLMIDRAVNDSNFKLMASKTKKSIVELVYFALADGDNNNSIAHLLDV